MALKEAYVNIVLDPTIKSSSLSKIQKDLEQITSLNILSDKDLKALRVEMEKANDVKLAVAQLKAALSALEGLTSKESELARQKIQEKLKELQGETEEAQEKVHKNYWGKISDGLNTFGSQLKMGQTAFGQSLGIFTEGFGTGINLLTSEGEDFTDLLGDIGEGFIKGLADLINSGLDELSDIVGFSRMSSSTTRNLMLSYGFNSSQAYGFNKTMGLLGFESEEDLMYATTEELQTFRELFQKYTEKYDEYIGNGLVEKFRQFDIEYKEFQEDLKLEVVDFFMKHKDEIITTMDLVMDIAEGVLEIVSFFTRDRTKGISDSERSARLSEIVNTNWNNNNIKIDNTFNGLNPQVQSMVNFATSSLGAQLLQAYKALI